MFTPAESTDETQIKAEMITVAYDHLGFSSFAVIVNAFVLSMALWSVIDHATILIWVIAVLSVSLFRYYSSLRFRHHREKYTVKYWEQLFLAGVTVSAIFWASASFVLFTPESIMHQAMLIIVLAGISAGAVSSLASVLTAIRIFLVLLLVPLLIQLLLQGTELHYWTALLIVMFIALVLTISKRFNENHLKVIKSHLMYEKAKEERDLTAERFETVFREAPAGIFLYDSDLKILEINQEFSDFLDTPPDSLIGLDMKQLPDQRILPAIQAVMDDSGGYYEGEYRTKYKRKETWISMRTSPVLDANRHVIGGIAIISDITERMNDQKKIQHQAYYDALTNIPNRTLLIERIHHEIGRFKRHHIIAGMLFLDLDHFKNINDSLGHQVGDQLLIETAKRLKSILRDEDTLSRLGGDEFVILLPDLGSEPIPALGKAEHVAEKVHRALEEPFILQGHELSTSASIGMVITDDDNSTTEDLIKHADMAMYQAKKEWRGSTSFYRPEMDRMIKRRLRIDHALRSTVSANELELYFQPIIEFATGNVIGAEALLRWENPKLGRITPDEFIPIAEESGVIIEIGEWVLNRACEQFAQWQKELGAATHLRKIAVNVSSKQFNETTFFDKVLHAISRSGIKSAQLELELTESIIIDNLEKVSEKMRQLRAHNIGISIDDFGTGYSSLSYLKKLPFSTLKIDKSFTQDIQTNADDAELIRTIITIAHSFHLNVIAEGVETAEQYAFLHEHRCSCFQGYYCSPPLPGKAFGDLLHDKSRACTDTPVNI
ncbi:EAL domain-containing protein [Sulfurimonas sp. HSL3-7]|uniref:putative bifunctional diguanylate cyclase/phosphodiesterase n=1 Tax=Sulfonitrofixus jiaomeiensis TaxID=3131938 RepID=UPI0031F81B67